MIGICAVAASDFDGARHLPSVHYRQVHVEQHDVGAFRPRAVDGALAVRRQDHVVAAPLEPARQEIPDLLVILDE